MRLLAWGEVQRMVYSHQPGIVEVKMTTARRAGWTTLVRLSRDDYLDLPADRD